MKNKNDSAFSQRTASARIFWAVLVKNSLDQTRLREDPNLLWSD